MSPDHPAGTRRSTSAGAASRAPDSGLPAGDAAVGERGRLTAIGVRPRRRLGQNFLLDPRIPQEMVDRAAWTAASPVLEIGAGGGALTAALLAGGRRVTAVEIDRVLVEVLQRRFASELAEDRLRVVHADILDLPLVPLLEDLADPSDRPGSPPGPGPTPAPEVRPKPPRGRDSAGRGADSTATSQARPWIAGNLPYSITTAILLRILDHADRLAGAVFMVQREYGDRLLARPGGDAYASISVRTAAQAAVRQLLLVGRSAFWPRPGVESIVLELTFPRPAPYAGSIASLERVLRAGFGQRRKTLENALSHGLDCSKEEARALLREAGCDPGARAETLPLERFAALARLLPGG